MKWLLLGLLLLAPAAWALDDPTQPSRTTTEAAPATSTSADAVTASMVRLSAEDAVAVINGQTVRRGDTVEGMRVGRIHAGGVTLFRDDNDHLEVPVSPRTGIELRRH